MFRLRLEPYILPNGDSDLGACRRRPCRFHVYDTENDLDRLLDALKLWQLAGMSRVGLAGEVHGCQH
jgi:hypothetical protein